MIWLSVLIWIIGWMFTVGFSDSAQFDKLGFGSLLIGFLSFFFWPIFLGYDIHDSLDEFLDIIESIII